LTLCNGSFLPHSEEEFVKTQLGGYTNLLQPGEGGAKKRTHEINVKDLPAEIDWRDKVIRLPITTLLMQVCNKTKCTCVKHFSSFAIPSDIDCLLTFKHMNEFAMNLIKN
jgi:hypothetical protein